MLAGLPVNVAALTGRDKGRVRESTLMGLADGSIHILVGTHAIFQEAVAYRDHGDRGRSRRAQCHADRDRTCRPIRPRPASPIARARRAGDRALYLPADPRQWLERDVARAPGADARDQ